jgi:hypothetical protein
MFNFSSSWRRLSVTLLAIGPLALTLSGCGGSGEDSTENVLTKARYIGQADAICKEVDKKQQSALTAYVKKHPQGQDTPAAQAAAVVAVGIPPDKVGVEEIRSLNPPAADEQEISSLLDDLEEALKMVEEDPTSVMAGKTQPFEEINQRTAKYGFKACSQMP